MGMYALIEDTQKAALDVANCWHEEPDAKALLAKIDAYERLSDCWTGELPEVARAFTEAANDVEGELDTIRRDAVFDAADVLAGADNRDSDEWQDAWEEADNDAPQIEQVIREARCAHAGDDYLKPFVA